MLSFSYIMQVNAADNFFLAAYVEENKKKEQVKPNQLSHLLSLLSMKHHKHLCLFHQG